MTGEKRASVFRTAEWLDRAASAGEPEAMALLGMMNGIGFPLIRDPDAAIGRYRMAAKKHDGKACLPLAFAYGEKGGQSRAGFRFDRAGGCIGKPVLATFS